MKISNPQQNIFHVQNCYNDTSIGVICCSRIFPGHLDHGLLKKAIQWTVHRQSAFSLRFEKKEGEWTQQIVEGMEYAIEEITFQEEESCKEHIRKLAHTPMEIEKPLFKFVILERNGKTGIILQVHHLIADATSVSIVLSDIQEAYENLSKGQELDPEVFRYEEHILEDSRYPMSNAYFRDEAYWRDAYSVKVERSLFKHGQKDAESAIAKRHTMNLPESLAQSAIENKLSLSVQLETVLAAYLHKLNQENQAICLGVLSMNRKTRRDKKTMGMYVETVPMRIQMQEGMTLETLSNGIKAENLACLRHQKYPFDKIREYIREKHGITRLPYDVVVSCQADILDAGDVMWHHNGYSEVPLQFHLIKRHGKLELSIDYQEEVFTEAEIEQLYKRLLHLWGLLIDNPGMAVKDVEVLPEEERNRLANAYNDTDAEYEKLPVHVMFKKQCERYPGNVAMIFHGKHFTYDMLDRFSNSLAHEIRQRGIGRNQLVPIISSRDWRYVVAVLAVLKAGGAFMPVSPSHPVDRIRKMLQNANASLALVFGFQEDLGIETMDLASFDYRKNPSEVENVNDCEDMCYAIFTSGSTGEPKGLCIRHRNFANYACANEHNKCVSMIQEECSTILASTSFVFDVSMSETLLPMVLGKTILLADDTEAESQSDVSRLMHAYHFDVLNATPTKMKAFMKDVRYRSYLNQAKVINLAGEPFPPSMFGELRKYTNAAIFNLYGPAETTVWCTEKQMLDENVTLGKPIINNRIYILGKDGTMMPAGVAGELCIGGESVGMGYLNKEELTREKYVQDPFVSGGIMYKSGDLALWNEDGEIISLGRIDTQVKVHGQRIETGEIESLLCQEEGIEEAVVIKQTDEEQEALVAFYTSRKEMDATRVKESLMQHLPSFMIPKAFERVEKMPLTQSNKIDRKGFPHVRIQKEECILTPPVTEMEKELCLAMESVTGKAIGRESDFIDQFGSLDAMEVISILSEKGIRFSVRDMYSHNTVQRLASFLAGGKECQEEKITVDVTDIQEILDRNAQEPGNVSKKPLGNLLLTGATGYLGAHLLAEFLREETGDAYCIIRGRDQEEAHGRLLSALKFYFGDTIPLDRIHALQGDLAMEKMGLAKDTWEMLGKNVGTVMHSAANVAHAGKYETFYRDNVLATENVVRFCEEFGKQLVHVSTCSVSSDGFSKVSLKEAFDETKLYIGQPLDNVYARSKLEAEKLVLEHARNGLKAIIVRMGNLANRWDGKFQRNYQTNAFQRRMAALLEEGIISREMMEMDLEMTPVDDAAKAVLKLSCHTDGVHTVFHITNTHVTKVKNLLAMAEKIMGKKTQVVQMDEFLKAIGKIPAFANDFDNDGNLVLPGKIHVCSDITERYLARLGFAWKDINESYLRGFIENLRRNHML